MFRKPIAAALIGLALASISARGGQQVSISQHDGLVWADVSCGATVLHFVVDTGAASTCIDLAAAKRLNIRLGKSMDVAGVCGWAIGYDCAGFQASVGGMRLPRKVVALDLSGPARGCSEAIDGLIGADFFRGKVVRIDYARSLLGLATGPANGDGMRLRFAAGVICVPVTVDGGPTRWTRLDTGCTDALDWCEGACRHSTGARKSVALASTGGSALLSEVTMGTAHLHDVSVKMRDRDIFPGEAGLLGNATLSRYRSVTIDGIHKRLLLEPAR